MVKNLPAMQETQVWSLGWKDPLEEDSTPVFLPGQSHGQRSLASYSPWCHKEADTTEATNTPETLLESQKRWIRKKLLEETKNEQMVQSLFLWEFCYIEWRGGKDGGTQEIEKRGLRADACAILWASWHRGQPWPWGTWSGESHLPNRAT